MLIYFQTASTILFVFIFSVPPLLDGKNLHDLVVVAGDRVKFDVPFQGIPTPEVKWIKVCFVVKLNNSRLIINTFKNFVKSIEKFFPIFF